MTGPAVAELSPRKQRLYELLLAERRRSEEGRRTVRRRESRGPVRLSSTQERLWFLCALDPGGAGFKIPFALRLQGRLDLCALARALTEIVRRHEPLRTRFWTRDGEPVQSVEPAALLRPAVVDLSGLPEEPRDRAARGVAALEAAHSMDLGCPPLLRCVVARETRRSHLLHLTIHHLVADGWSMGIFVRELGELYRGLARGEVPGLAELPVRYSDFVAWEREFLDGDASREQLRHWMAVLRDVPAVLELPTDRPRDAVQGDAGSSRTLFLPAPLAGQVAGLARGEGATLFMVLLSAFSVLLHRYSGQGDFCVGTPVANRNRPELEPLIGLFVNTLALRVAVDPVESFASFLRRCRERVVGAFQHQDLPFGRLVEELHPTRDVSHTPLFQVMLVLQNAPLPPLELPDLLIETEDLEQRTAEFDLTLVVRELRDGRLRVGLEFSTALFDATTIARMAAQFRGLLEQGARAPDTPVSEMDILRPVERHQLLREWNDRPGPTGLDGDVTVHELVRATIDALPDAVAVEGAGRTLSYRELGVRVNRLALRLRSLGTPPGGSVAVCLDRTPELVVALLAVLEAGAAYVPLDPSYPPERIRFLLADSRAALLVTRSGLAVQGGLSRERTVFLDGSEPQVENAGEPPAENPVTPLHGAYTIYTSGSTGVPKGVQVSHRALVHHCQVLGHRYGLGSSDRVLQFVSIGFDVAAQEIFPSLAAGAAVVLRSDDLGGAIGRFAEEVERQRLSVLNIPTPYWHEWVSALEEGTVPVPSSVRVLVVGTEQTLHDRWRRWRNVVGERVRLVNGYGPTEATIEATFFEPQGDEDQPAHGGVPIGRPFENSAVFVVDRQGRPTAPGIPGELAISGVGLAWGYAHRPALSAEKFVPDGFGGAAGGRLYRSGDLVRTRWDGNVECLGRIDDQVKIRGFRVELGEVEAALTRLPRVREAAAVAVPSGGGRRLLACLVLDGGASRPSVGELRDLLEGRLPEYMIPTGFAFADELPLTPNGKVDRRALEALEVPDPSSEREYVPPQSELEATVARVWAEVLGVGRVGLEDNFFDMGGHSLLMIRVQARLADDLATPVSLLDLFRHPTVSALARHLTTGDDRVPGLAGRVSRAERRISAGDRRRRRRASAASRLSEER